MRILPDPLRSPAARTLIVPADFFVLWTPLLSLDEFLAWGEDLAAPRAAEGALLEALQGDRVRLRERLAGAFARPEVEEALRLAAPGLHGALTHWRREPEGKRGQKVERALVRFFARLCAQPVARGLLGGFSQGQTTRGRETRLRLQERARYRRHSRLEIESLCTLAEALGRSAALQEQLTYRCNDTLHIGATQVRCAVAGREGGQRSYRLLATERTDYLVATLERARAGARRADLVAALVAMDEEISPEEAAGYVAALVDAQLLVADLSPPVTGAAPHVALAEVLGGHTETQAVAAELRSVAATLDAIDAGGWQVAPAHAEALSRGLMTLATHAGLPPSPVPGPWIRVDLVKPGEDVRLGRGPLDEMRRGVELLRHLGPAEDGLQRFRERFVMRYGDEEVPLLAVLDEEAGIGFGAPEASEAGGEPLIAGLQFTGTGTGAAQAQRLTSRHTFLLEKVSGALGRGERVIELGKRGSRDLEQLATRDPLPLPAAFAVLATLAASSEEALAAGHFQILLEEVSGPSGAQRLCRLCHADRALAAAVERHLRAEEARRPEAIFAEVVHLPDGGAEGRPGGLAAGHMVRPLLRGYEIPLLGASGAPPERQLALADLHVSVLGERVVLRSRRLGREVLPRVTAGSKGMAGAAAHHLGLYRFLCALEQQGVAAALSFDWGPLAAMPFLPRVVSGRLVLARARWRMEGTRQRALLARSLDERYRAVQALRAERGLPRHVALVEAGGELLVDLDNALSVESLVQRLRHLRERAATLMEPWPPVDAVCARGPEGRFVHRLIVPFTVRAAQVPEGPERSLRTTPAVLTVPRRLPPGSDWLGVKIYTGTAGVDEVLREVVAPVVAAADGAQALQRWFFVRYIDSAWHLRVRFHGAPEALLGEVRRHLLAALEPLHAAGRVHRVELDTYDREVDRYGGSEGLLLAERIFHADSEAVLGIVDTLSGDEGAQARWQLAVVGIARLLGDLGLGPEEQLTLLDELRRDFAARLQVDARLVRQLGQRYRQERPALEALLAASAAGEMPGVMIDEAHPLAPGLSLLARRSAAIAPTAAELQGLARAGQLTHAVPKLAMSYVHMFANRLLRTSALAQELVIYDFLARLGREHRARK
jgi:thiopeptide-type bacteriocin biosynthesis protein